MEPRPRPPLYWREKGELESLGPTPDPAKVEQIKAKFANLRAAQHPGWERRLKRAQAEWGRKVFEDCC